MIVDTDSRMYALHKICINRHNCDVFLFLGECPYLCECFESEEPLDWDDEPSDFALMKAQEFLL